MLDRRGAAGAVRHARSRGGVRDRGPGRDHARRAVVQVGAPADVWRAPGRRVDRRVSRLRCRRSPARSRDGRRATRRGVRSPRRRARRRARSTSSAPRRGAPRRRRTDRGDGRRVRRSRARTSSSRAVAERGPALTVVGRAARRAGVGRPGARWRSIPTPCSSIRVGQTDRRWRPRRRSKTARAMLARRDPVLERMLREHGVPDCTAPAAAPALRRARPHDLLPAARGPGRGGDPRPVRGAVRRRRRRPRRCSRCRSRRCAARACRTPRPRRSATSREKVEEGLVELDRMGRLPDDEGRARARPRARHRRVDRAHVPDVPARPARRVARRRLRRPRRLRPCCTASRRCRRRSSSNPRATRSGPYRSLVAWYCWRAADTVTPVLRRRDAALSRSRRR